MIGPLNSANANAATIQIAHARTTQQELQNSQHSVQKKPLERVRAFDEEMAASNKGAAQDNNRTLYTANGGVSASKLNMSGDTQRGAILDVVV